MLSVIVFILVCISNNVTFGRLVYVRENPNDLTCEPDCDSEIYCKGGPGTLLHEVQMKQIYGPDGTTFVKKKMKFSENVTLEKYHAKISGGNLLSKDDLGKFVAEYFENEDLNKTVTLTDFKENPTLLQKVKDPKLNKWLSELNKFWKTLARKVPDSLKNANPKERVSSYIYVPNTFIVAGGRFDEMYYWDSYWIIQGLLACEMYDTARGIIENIIHLVNEIGYMPNGNRLYYSKRSQPPMLIQMADIYYKATKNATFIKNNLKAFGSELLWWYTHRQVEVNKDNKTYSVYRYHSVSCYPRPESYKEDYELLNNYSPRDIDEERRIYTGIRSAAESGWDFSSRHMRNPNNSIEMHEGLRDMNPGQFAYVDLNAIMYSNAKILSDWVSDIGEDKAEAKKFENIANKTLDTIENLLWSEKFGMWLDYDLLNGKPRNNFFPSNLVPLWSKTYLATPKKVKRAVEYLIEQNIIDTNFNPVLDGVPTSNQHMNASKQQWDYPNIWAPLQSFIIRGLQESNNEVAQKVAYNLATAFVRTAYAGYAKYEGTNCTMYEKYDGEKCGVGGTKGEYECATGFGWTNGLIFELFNMWGCFPISSDIQCKKSQF